MAQGHTDLMVLNANETKQIPVPGFLMLILKIKCQQTTMFGLNPAHKRALYSPRSACTRISILSHRQMGTTWSELLPNLPSVFQLSGRFLSLTTGISCLAHRKTQA